MLIIIKENVIKIRRIFKVVFVYMFFVFFVLIVEVYIF